jgi:hypothetical protein
MDARIKALVAFCGEYGRVCPKPTEWNYLYNILPDKRRNGAGWEPPLPLILAAWDDTPALMKMLRLEEHIKWASNHGALDAVEAFLRGLAEDQWFHLGQ